MDFGEFDFNVRPTNSLFRGKVIFHLSINQYYLLDWKLMVGCCFIFFRVLTWETLTRLERKVKVLDHL